MRPGGETEGEGFRVSEPLRGFAGTVRRVLLEPGGFFRNMARADSLWNPLVFAVVCALVSSLLAYLAAPLDPFVGPEGGFGGLFAGAGDRSPASVAALVLVVLFLTPCSCCSSCMSGPPSIRFWLGSSMVVRMRGSTPPCEYTLTLRR
ncbi:MAG: hypothetical protein M3157_01925 [Actinomycetota bacterium]|nr:hypothetical protein [Actinomycetota bacterium]